MEMHARRRHGWTVSALAPEPEPDAEERAPPPPVPNGPGDGSGYRRSGAQRVGRARRRPSWRPMVRGQAAGSASSSDGLSEPHTPSSRPCSDVCLNSRLMSCGSSTVRRGWTLAPTMTMAKFVPDARLEGKASGLWRTYKLEPAFDVEELLDELDLGLLWEAMEDGEGVLLGALQPGKRRVVINERHRSRFDRIPGLLRFTQAHEVGHWLFHCEDAAARQSSIWREDRIWCRDGSTDPLEYQANRFAGYLLMPADQLRPLLPPSPWGGWPLVYRLAEKFAVSPTAMIVRLESSGWAHRDEGGVPHSGPAKPVDGAQTELPL